MIETYTQAIEYFEAINCDKYIFMGQKLKDVYHNPKVIRILNSNCGLEAFWYKDKKKEQMIQKSQEEIQSVKVFV